MTHSTPKPTYHAYLIRLWVSREQGQMVWRASLENAHSGERLAFASLQRLFDFLQDQTTATSENPNQV